jgi:hypothetical protein
MRLEEKSGEVSALRGYRFPGLLRLNTLCSKVAYS